MKLQYWFHFSSLSHGKDIPPPQPAGVEAVWVHFPSWFVHFSCCSQWHLPDCLLSHTQKKYHMVFSGVFHRVINKRAEQDIPGCCWGLVAFSSLLITLLTRPSLVKLVDLKHIVAFNQLYILTLVPIPDIDRSVGARNGDRYSQCLCACCAHLWNYCFHKSMSSLLGSCRIVTTSLYSNIIDPQAGDVAEFVFPVLMMDDRQHNTFTVLVLDQHVSVLCPRWVIS